MAKQRDGDGFTHAAYADLLLEFLYSGYSAVDYDTVDKDRAELVLRHDLDFSLVRAMPLAELEHELGVRAHYFVLVGSRFYNIYVPESRQMLRRLVDLGHTVGLHFDAATVGEGESGLDRAVDEEARALEIVTGAEVEVVSFHRPAPQYIDWDRSIAGRRHTYQPRFYSEIAYVSDSRGAFRHGEPTDHPAFVQRRAMQLLIHPIWWTPEPTSDRLGAVDDVLESIGREARDAALRNSEPFLTRSMQGLGVA
jgi:hypothetical protein